ncbi:hypothetical protein H4R27_005780 [Coemansia aciculifera]|nr:hypothetical protein H4R27_005780 [Coemansia aciculifera]
MSSPRLVTSAKHCPVRLLARPASVLHQRRHASILGPEHRPRPSLRPAAATTTTGVASSPQQQQQQTLTSASQQQHKAIGTNIARPTPTPRLPSYIFRHRGTVPSEPQAIDSLQFILNQKPLGATTLVSGNEGTRLFMLGTHMDSEVRTAEEAREKARLRLQELNDIVQSASGLMAALTKAQVAHDAKVVGRAAQLIPLANNDQLLDAEVLEEDGSEGFSRRKLAIVASSVLGISSAAVCLGVLLAPEFVGFV